MSPFEFVCPFYFAYAAATAWAGRSCFRLCMSYGETGGVGVAQLMTQALERDANPPSGFVLFGNWRNDSKQVQSHS
jgi:hypothetical protein